MIDDSVTFREALRATLEQASYRVIVSDTGEDGLRLASDRRPTAVVVDGQLPGIDGATVIRRIRLDAALRGLPCLLLTASEERGAEVRALEAGADAFVRKDEDTALILARLNAVLRSAGGRSQDAGPERGTASLLGPKKILAVDDSETYLQELASALRADGYEVVLARSGEEALELLGVQQVDCVLLDLLMPGIGGRETCRRVKSSADMRDIPVVMLTAVEDREAMIQGLGAGADDYIAKSSDFDLLRARVHAQIRRKQFEDETRRIREQLLRAELEAVEARAAREMAEQRAALVAELEAKNEELEAFSYSVAHDLRAPLRSIDGFGLALLEDYADRLDDDGRQYLNYVRESAQQMSQLIDDMLALSRVTRGEFERTRFDLSRIARVGRCRARARCSRPAGRFHRCGRPDRRRRRETGDDRDGESAWQCVEIFAAARARANRSRRSCRRAAGVLRARQRGGLRYGLRRQAVRHVSASACKQRVRRNRHRACDRAARDPASWRTNLGRRRSRAGRDFFLHACRRRADGPATIETDSGAARCRMTLQFC